MSSIIETRLKEINDRKWGFEVGDTSVIIGEQVDKIVEAVTAVKDLGTSLATLDPVHAGIPWAGICVLLSVSIGQEFTLYSLTSCCFS